MDIVERLRREYESIGAALHADAADEIERLREEIASCTADIAREVSEGNRYMLEAAGLREQLAEAHAETDSVVYARDRAYEQLAACLKDAERYRWLRSKRRSTDQLMCLVGFNDTDELDAAIDAAMKEAK